ncbi:MAG: DNA gyrase inhibitor YacG [Proteobacteria bacterium]|nr:DNA gyrase inhibitor YacG [Pseudomonadota bacterium]
MNEPKCPICRRPAAPRFRPFCSSRCADLDLHKWLSGGYAVAGDADGETSADPSGGAEDES